MTSHFASVSRPVLCILSVMCFAVATCAHGQSSTNAQPLIDKGAEALRNGDPESASTLFAQALKRDPRSVDAHTYLGVIADEKGDLKSAESHFAAAVVLAPNSASARNNHGTVLLKLGRRQDAISELEKSLQLDEHQPGALLNLAQAYFQGGTDPDLRRAHKLFAHARKVLPDAAPARATLVTSIRLKDRTAAAQDYVEYRERVTHAEGGIVGPSARLEIGQSLSEVGLYGPAREELSAVVAAQPDNPAGLVALAKAERLDGRIAEARKVLESALARGIKSGAIYEEIAEIYDSSGHVENAIPAMRLAIAADPGNEYYHLRYGLLLNDTQAPAAAVLRLRDAVSMFPESPAIHFALGLAYYADHKNKDAATCFDKSISLDPKFAPAYAYRGLILADAGKYAEAIQQYERSAALDPNTAVVHELMGEAILRQPNPDTARAEQELKRAIELDPSYVAASLELAKLLQRHGNAAAAAQELERVVRIDSKLAQPHYLLGRAYAALKRPEDSRREFNLFRELDKASKQAEVDARSDLLRRLANVRY